MYKALFFFFLTTDLLGQPYVKEFFDKAGNRVEEQQSEFFVIGKKVLRLDNAFGLTDTVESYVDTVRAFYIRGGRPKFIRIYDKNAVQHGHFIEYYASGKVKARGNVEAGEESGLAVYYHKNGKMKSTIEYLGTDHMDPERRRSRYRIISYRDSTGRELVGEGNGMCDCYLFSEHREVGSVVNGFRDSIWSEYSGDTLLLQEQYTDGSFREGVRYLGQTSYKYRFREEPPSFKGGEAAMVEMVRKNIKVPASTLQAGATVYIAFEVRTDGSIDDVLIVKGLRKDIDKEAVRIVRLMSGQWNPGRKRGEPVNTRVTLPLRLF